MDLRGLERDLRKLPGVVACAIAGDTVSVLLSQDADHGVVGKEAAEIAASYGAPAVRLLESPDAYSVTRRTATPMRARLAIGTAAAAAIALIASLVPVARKVAPRQPPAAIRPAPAPEFGGVLPAVLIPEIRPVAAPRLGPAVSGPVSSAGSIRVPGRPSRRLAPTPPVSAPKPTAEEPEPEQCGPPGHAWGRSNHEGDGNNSRHRHHGRNNSRYEHWFDCS